MPATLVRYRLVQPALVATAACAAVALVGTVDPNQPGHYPTCPLLFLTGYYCPGCGALRATHALVHLDPVTAWAMNPLFVLQVPFLIAAFFAWTHRRATGRPRWVAPAWMIYVLLAVVTLFGIARNLPYFSDLAPG